MRPMTTREECPCCFDGPTKPTMKQDHAGYVGAFLSGFFAGQVGVAEAPTDLLCPAHAAMALDALRFIDHNTDESKS